MVEFEPFEVESWMDEYEMKAQHNIAETCCASISLSDLSSFSTEPSHEILGGDKAASVLPKTQKLNYGSIRGSDVLRARIADLYHPIDEENGDKKLIHAENIVSTNGAIAANFLVLLSLVKKGDRVICQYPTYGQLYQVPRALGAQVELWKPLRRLKIPKEGAGSAEWIGGEADYSWEWSIDDLNTLLEKDALMAKTKLIILNNPNNPSGAILSRSHLQQIIEVATTHGETQDQPIHILSDEVYRPIFHTSQPPPSLLDLKPLPSFNTPILLATGSLSKAYALAGIRAGWVACSSLPVLNALADTRHYTTLSVSQLDESVAAFALAKHTRPNLVRRNEELARTNAALLASFIVRFKDFCSWVPPVGGTTAFVRFFRIHDGKKRPVDDVQLAKVLIDEYGILVVPGSRCFADRKSVGSEKNFRGYVRIGYVCETVVLEKALEVLGQFLQGGFDNIPVW